MNRFWAIFLVLLSVCFAGAQDVNSLKEKQKRNEKELQYTNKILKDVRSKQSSSLSRLKALQQDIKTREASVQLYKEEVHKYEKEIGKASVEIGNLTEKQIALKRLYGELLVNAYLKGSRFDKWLYVFSAKDFSQAYNRYKYYDQFTNYTKKQLGVLTSLKDSVSAKTEKVKRLKREREGLVVKAETAKKSLDEKKQEQQKEIDRLKSKEKDLLSRLKVQQQRQRNLEKRIKKLIAKSVKKAAKKPPSKADVKLNTSFAENKGKLPWPAKGFISSAFGEHAHPVLKTVKVRNDGIDITTQKGDVCKSVFEGEVSQILSIPGLNNTVIIKHGTYLSVYANLVGVRVKKGAKVKTGQILGKIATGTDGSTVLKLQIWKNTSRQNPQYWLRKK